MNFGDILVAKGLVKEADISRALEHQRQHGGRLGDSVVAIGALTREQVDAVINEAPQAPTSIADTGIDRASLLQLVLKGMYLGKLERPAQLSEALKLFGIMVNELLQEAKERKLVDVMGAAPGASGITEMRYALTAAGREWAAEAVEQNQYFGPAPVSLSDYQERIQRQRITNELVSREMLESAFKGLVIPPGFLNRLGPAVNSGNPILIYGPAGNGKTTIAEIVGRLFENIVYIPYAVDLGGEIMKVYDPTVHQVVESTTGPETVASLRIGRIDRRWVPCHRPVVVAGGELTLEMLDLKYNSEARFYEAPLHIKALNGTFLIDDFGRQRARPEEILNRWIVPLNSHVDYLNLHSGKSVQIPFDETVIFSTNLHPDDLMDPAFQRRISYKLETLEPPEDLFRRTFEDLAAKRGLALSEEIYQQTLAGLRGQQAPLAYYQPKFIIEQVLAACKFEGVKPEFTKQNVADALANLFVPRKTSPASEAAK